MSKEAVHVHLRKTKPLVVGDKVFKSANDCELTVEELEKARVELGETEENKRKCLIELKDKLSKDENVNYCTDDAYLLRFLRVRKYDVVKTHQYLEQYYEIRKKRPEAFTVPPNLEDLLNLNIVSYLPYSDEGGRIILLVDIDNWDPKEIPYEETQQSVSAVCDVITMNPRCQINGVIAIYDMKELSRGHLSAALSKNWLRVSVNLIQKGYPFRIHKMLIVNTSRIVRLLYTIVRPFLSRKLSERLVFTGSDMSELHQYVNPAILPKSLGGELDEKECCATQHIIENLPYLTYERNFM